jgi:HD-GYP domain-containing protein (c-di-GMP phosphodiesterase class II)
LALWRERLAGGVSHELAYGTVAALLVLAVREMGVFALALVAVSVVTIWLGQRHALRATHRSVRELSAANERLRRLTLTTVESLARTIEARDPYTGGHTERVADFAQAIGVRLELDEDELRAVAIGAVIHDIGKIGVSDAVLLKQGPLDADEWAVMRRHPEIGSYILGELEVPEQVKAMTRHHHERWDGRGYPDGLAGEDIPLTARLLTVADALDAMTSDRPYRSALALDVALAELREKAGSQFCPTVVAAALDVLSDLHT